MTDRPSAGEEPPGPGPSAGGRVVLVGTPIGNLGDLSPRAQEILQQADVICCEDTRRTRALLSAFGIPAGSRLRALHAHNEAAAADAAVRQAAAGATVAMVSDAGMPGISDPGERLVAAAVAAGVPVDVVPGPAAAITAVVLSGLPAGRWCFEGFLPRQGQARAQRLAAVAVDERTTVIYESPHRVARTLEDLRQACGDDRPVACVRELTKLHQEVWRGSAAGAVRWLEDHPPRGEWVVVVGGAPPVSVGADAVADALGAALDAGVDRRRAVADVARTLKVPKRQVYDAALAMPWPAR